MTKWREHLRGEYQITDRNAHNKMHCDIRNRARSMLEDLLLICQRAPKSDLIQIFFEPKTLEKVAMPLPRELENNTCVLKPDDPEFEEIQLLASGLTVYGMGYDIVKLVEDKQYRERKKVQLWSKRGVKKKLEIIGRTQRKNRISSPE